MSKKIAIVTGSILHNSNYIIDYYEVKNEDETYLRVSDGVFIFSVYKCTKYFVIDSEKSQKEFDKRIKKAEQQYKDFLKIDNALRY